MKKEEAKQRTIATLLTIARAHFTQHGYFHVSLEKIAEEANMTRGAVYHHFKNKKGMFLAVLEVVQQDVAVHIEQEASKSTDPWEQLLLGCIGFVKGANAKDCRRILLVDAPAVVGWDAWREVDREHSMNVLLDHVNELKSLGYLEDTVNTELMTSSISGALNELALSYPIESTEDTDETIAATIEQLTSGFKKT